MNNFEKYLNENKEQLEPKEIDPKIWLSIENEMLKQKSSRVIRFSKYMAAASILLLLGMFVFMNQHQKTSEEELLSKFNLSEYNFTQQVASRKQQLANTTIPKDKLEDFQILLQQLEFLDKQFQDFVDYIDESGYQEFIGNQIINHYKSKIKLLDKIQQEIEKINYYENKKPSNSEAIEIKI